jgi:hypothetical protein
VLQGCGVLLTQVLPAHTVDGMTVVLWGCGLCRPSSICLIRLSCNGHKGCIDAAVRRAMGTACACVCISWAVPCCFEFSGSVWVHMLCQSPESCMWVHMRDCHMTVTCVPWELLTPTLADKALCHGAVALRPHVACGMCCDVCM